MSNLASCWRVPSQINLVLRELRQSRLDDIQVPKASMAMLIARAIPTQGSCLVRLWDHNSVDTEPVPSLELTFGEEKRVEQKGADTSVVKIKHEKNPLTQKQKIRQENTKTWKKAKKKALDTNGLYIFNPRD